MAHRPPVRECRRTNGQVVASGNWPALPRGDPIARWLGRLNLHGSPHYRLAGHGAPATNRFASGVWRPVVLPGSPQCSGRGEPRGDQRSLAHGWRRGRRALLRRCAQQRGAHHSSVRGVSVVGRGGAVGAGAGARASCRLRPPDCLASVRGLRVLGLAARAHRAHDCGPDARRSNIGAHGGRPPDQRIPRRNHRYGRARPSCRRGADLCAGGAASTAV